MDRSNELADKLRLLAAAHVGVHPDRLYIELEFSLPTMHIPGRGPSTGWTARAHVFDGRSKRKELSSYSTRDNTYYGLMEYAFEGLIEEVARSFQKREPGQGEPPVMICDQNVFRHAEAVESVPTASR